MTYVIVENNSVIFGPSEWNRLLFQGVLLDDLEIIQTLDFVDPNKPVIINNEVSILPVVNMSISYDPTVQCLEGPFWTFSENTAIQSFNVVDRPLNEIKNHLKNIVSGNRYGEEVKGTKININGTEVSIPTDRTNKVPFFQQLSVASEQSIQWKFNNETWLPLTKVDFENICSAITNYVQSVYDWENEKFAEIDSKETSEELLAIKLTMTEQPRQGPKVRQGQE